MKKNFYLFMALLISQNLLAQTPFITTWKTDNTGSSNSTSITIPTTGTGYNYDVDWNNDGTFEQLGVTANITHDYTTAGTYTVAIRGSFPRIYFNNTGDRGKILSVVQWGNIAWGSMGRAFFGCNRLVINATDSPDLSIVTDLSYTFSEAVLVNSNVELWDVSHVTNMANMFFKAFAFNQNIGAWDVSNVTDMSNMFNDARAFNQNLNTWNVGMVTNMTSMFNNSKVFNGNISAWNVGEVTNMNTMFNNAPVFNQNIGAWNVGKVTNMNSMFNNAPLFNQNIGAWNVGKVTSMNSMFNTATSFNQNIGAWNITLATAMFDIFKNSGISLTNYDNILLAWNAAGYTNRNLGNASPLTYCAAQIARANLVGNRGWAITGDTYGVSCPKLFITTWKTDNVGSSNGTSITIPTTGTGYNYDVDWNSDGIFDDLGVTANITHDYGTVGSYIIVIRGSFPRIYFNNTGDKSKIMSVVQWGDIAWASMGQAFYGCNNLVINANDFPNLGAVTDMSQMFRGATSMNQNIGLWDVSQVTNMSQMFSRAIRFNQNIGAWDVSKVTNMSGMFNFANRFNQNIGAWDVSLVTDMSNMFNSDFSFNQNLNSWNVGLVSNMSFMFYGIGGFNGNISAWNTSNVTNMNTMFFGASAFNQNIGAWNVGKVTNMSYLFSNAIAFNQDISAWNVEKANDMNFMFDGATAFNQNLGAWNIALATTMTDVFKNSGISLTNYDNILLAWNTAGYTNKNLGSTLPLTYCAGQIARTNMITNKGWGITGDTYTNVCPITSIVSGNWAVGSTWNAGRVPQAGDNVIIDSNHTITLDGVTTIKKLEYRSTGKLLMNTTASRVNTGF